MWKKGSLLLSCHKSCKLCKQYYPGEFLFHPNAVLWQQLKDMQVISTRQALVPTESCSCHDLHLKKNTQRRSGLILFQDGGTAQTATDQSNDVQQNLRTVQPWSDFPVMIYPSWQQLHAPRSHYKLVLFNVLPSQSPTIVPNHATKLNHITNAGVIIMINSILQLQWNSSWL